MAHSHSFSQNHGQIAGIAALSAAIGAATAMLFAPRAGSDMRRAIRNRASSMRSKAEESKEDIKNAANDTKATAIKAKTAIKDAADKNTSEK